MTFEVACEKIINSAKRRFDYLQYEKEFIEALGTEKGSMLASNLVREVMIGLADNKKVDVIISDLNSQLASLGVHADITDQCKTIVAATKKEFDAFVMLRVYNQMGMNVDEAYAEVKKYLFVGYANPTDRERAAIENECLSLIIASAKKSIPCFNDCQKQELSQRPEKAERRMDTILCVSLGLFSAIEDVELGQIRDYLVGMMEKGTEPEWLMDFLQEAKASVGKELCAMNAMNIGWDKKMPINEITCAVRYRLDR